MIKVNLLPHKRVKTVEKSVIRVRILVAVSTVVVALGCLGWGYSLISKSSELSDKVEATTKRLDQLKAKVKEVDNFEETRKKLEAKLKTINDLEKREIPYTLLLNELNALTTKEIWFTSLSVNGPSFILDGKARNSQLENNMDGRKNATAFVNKLETSTIFSQVKLLDLKEDKGTFAFKVDAKLAGYENAVPPPAKQTPEQKKGGKKTAGKKPAGKKPAK